MSTNPYISIATLAGLSSLLDSNKIMVVVTPNNGQGSDTTVGNISLPDLRDNYLLLTVNEQIAALQSKPGNGAFTNPITLTFAGVVQGAVSFDGTENVTATLSMPDNSIPISAVEDLASTITALQNESGPATVLNSTYYSSLNTAQTTVLGYWNPSTVGLGSGEDQYGTILQLASDGATGPNATNYVNQLMLGSNGALVWRQNVNNTAWNIVSLWHSGNLNPALLATDSTVVHLAGTETITGLKTFTNNVSVTTAAPGGLTVTSSSTNSTSINVANTAVGGHVWSLASSGGGPGAAGKLVFYDNTSGGAQLTVGGNALSVPGSITAASVTINLTTALPASGVDSFGLILSGAYGGGIGLIDGTYNWGMWDQTGSLYFGSGSSLGALGAAMYLTAGGNLFPTGSVTATWPIATGTIANGGNGGNNGLVAHANNNGGASATSAAAMTFIRDGLFGGYFGLDTDNQFKVGGWSFGNVSYRVVHEGLSTVNLTTVNASTYGGTGVSQAASSGTVVQRNGSGYIFANYINATANDIGAAAITSLAVQTGGDGYHRWQTPANFISANNIATKAANVFTAVQTFSGLLTPPSGINPGGIGMGNGDSASFTANNMAIYSWNGIGFGPSITGQAVANGTFSHYFNVRTGDMGAQGIFTANRLVFGYDSGVANSLNTTDWLRSSGNVGWYSASYGGGVYMIDATYVRAYNGKAFAASDFVVTSDKYQKKYIRDFEFKGRLTPRSFTLREGDKPSFGFIAQEVRELYPEAVSNVKGEKYLSVSYNLLTAVLAHQVNTLEDELATTNQRLEVLTRQLTEVPPATPRPKAWWHRLTPRQWH